MSLRPSRRGTGHRRTPVDDDPDTVVDVLDEVPCGESDLSGDLRRMQLATSSGVYADRRRE